MEETVFLENLGSTGCLVATEQMALRVKMVVMACPEKTVVLEKTEKMERTVDLAPKDPQASVVLKARRDPQDPKANVVMMDATELPGDRGCLSTTIPWRKNCSYRLLLHRITLA